MPLTLGIDMGASNVRYGLVDRGGKVLTTASAPLPHSVADRARLPREIARSFAGKHIGVGLAIAGTVRDGVLTWAANLGFSGVDYAAELAQVSGVPAVVINDARAAGYAEALVGAGAGAASVLTVSVGTGIGGALVIDGSPYLGTGAAGEIGHMVIDPSGPTCSCGRRGCWERFVGGRALMSAASELYPDAAEPLEGLLRDAERGDSEGERLLARCAAYFRLGIDNLRAVLAPDVLVVGGGIVARNGPVAHAYITAAETGAERWESGVLRVSHLGDAGAMIGAGLAAFNANR